MNQLFVKIRNSKAARHVFLFLAVMGPGIITANVDNDAGGIATYSMAGAHFGYTLLWSLIPITIALIIVQEMCARMAVATGKGLADLIRENYGVKVTFYMMLTLFFVNLSNAMAEFAGIAVSLEIFHISKFISVPISAFFVWMLVVKGTYKSVEKIFLFACLFYVAYVISGFIAKPDWSDVLKQTVTPSFNWTLDYTVMLVGLVGTTIAPWMQFYLQSSIVEKGVTIEEYRHLRIDVVAGCIIAPIIAFFIVVACAATMFHAGITIESAQDAALALKPLAGNYASWLFAFGLFNASIFAASVLPLSTAYSICEGLGWDAGVDKRFEEAPQFFWLYAAMIIIGAGVVLLPNFPLFKVMYFSQVGNGVLLPFILIYMLRLINNKDIMGEFVNSKGLNIIAWVTVFIIITLTLIMVGFTVFLPGKAL
ncbi:MAG: Mn transporter [Omnitrophica WOR_2 bacterium GWF2_38_59]|nr:MAG: Mn transporter [Omnitrophica WOR_2 bacterium GWF2_38_59]OGX53448.1 MAG: Mn transporter [Omnitrophica WOR_2 bacterium RIFOXYA12_FULL_38_10]OGX58849.1 MAG: Mn transporter [Omnitrophica WOR_2 bacterium RIFOXYC2_FULL_38_12]OGX59847.1 MAG: Mn transporter [Omnitrophica WOR_2 bacterium RIFOXYB2_FULL_38_16]HBG61985.1 Mn transporter [Candidatus Omnitrophota bacterium]